MEIDILIDKFTPCVERAGGYVDYVPGRPFIIDADYRAMLEYCKEKGINHEKQTFTAHLLRPLPDRDKTCYSRCRGFKSFPEFFCLLLLV